MSLMNKDKRSMCLMLILGDGCLHTNSQNYSRLTIDHGLAQADYQKWKAELLSSIFERPVKTRQGHKGKSIQIQVGDRKFRSWRKFTYPNNKKDIARILPFIRHPELALAVWLMDDGYVEYSFDRNMLPKQIVYCARFRLFTCDQSNETQEKVIQWFKDNFEVTLKIHLTKKKDKYYPYLKINSQDSLKLWTRIREFVLQFPSMQHKFRHMESVYQRRVSQHNPIQQD